MAIFRKSNNHGTAAIEFAILLPFLLLMFFGVFEISRYILVIRKVENVTNDVGFLLSREGTVHDIDGDGSVNSSSEDSARIERIAKAVVPILMTPYASDSYEIEIRSVARPTTASISPNSGRVMWSHKITEVGSADNKASVSPSGGFSFAASTSNVSGASAPSSIYSDNFGDRAELVFPGQTFLLVNFAYGYDQVINNLVNLVKLDLSGNDIEKTSSYAVRSRWIDNGDGIIQANEFFNQMQICTNCNTFSSDNLGGQAGPACETGAAREAHKDTSGCIFN